MNVKHSLLVNYGTSVPHTILIGYCIECIDWIENVKPNDRRIAVALSSSSFIGWHYSNSVTNYTRYDTSANNNNVMNDTDTQDKVADSSDINSHNMFWYFFHWNSGRIKLIQCLVLSNIPTRSTIYSLFSANRMEKETKKEKNNSMNESNLLFFPLLSTYKSQIQPIEGFSIKPQ